MKYTVIGAEDWVTLEQKVNNQMKLGWKPLGGVSGIVLASGGMIWAQAMVSTIAPE